MAFKRLERNASKDAHCVLRGVHLSNGMGLLGNGDIGFIREINKTEQEIVIEFDERKIKYDFTDLDQITLAYAITIHKSQGSEYPVVIIPLLMQHYVMLKRNLIYTAVTRGKKLVIILGESKALALALKEKISTKRYSKLKEMLQVA